jgi:hypothetical protein
VTPEELVLESLSVAGRKRSMLSPPRIVNPLSGRKEERKLVRGFPWRTKEMERRRLVK